MFDVRSSTLHFSSRSNAWSNLVTPAVISHSSAKKECCLAKSAKSSRLQPANLLPVMPKYKIAWLPGDGVGVDVLAAARIVLDRLALDAEYIPGDIGWEFWRREGDGLPGRTITLLKKVDAALFGAITSKPAKAAQAELAPNLQNNGHTYRSPIVRMRQLFELYICLRPCKGYAGNPLNYRENIDLVVFRENTEDLYAGVEFAPVPQELAETLARLAKPFTPFAKVPGDQYAISCKINTAAGSERIARAAFDFARRNKRKKV